MRRAWLLVALCAAAGALAPAAAARPRPASPWAASGLVRAPGGPFLRDRLGRRLQLHGVNLVAKCGGGARATDAPGTPCVGPTRRAAARLRPLARGRRSGPALHRRRRPHARAPRVQLGAARDHLAGPRARAEGREARRSALLRAPRRGHAVPAARRRRALRRRHRPALPGPHRPHRRPAAPGRDPLAHRHAPGRLRLRLLATPRAPSPWNGEGAAPWATCTDGDPFGPPDSWDETYGDPAGITAIHHFFSNDVRGDLQGQFARVWRVVARHFRGDRAVLGYDVLNEPADVTDRLFDRELECLYAGPVRARRLMPASRDAGADRGVVGAIQAADPTHVVFVEPSVLTNFGAGQTLGIAQPLRLRNVGLAFHPYGGPSAFAKVLEERGADADAPAGRPAALRRRVRRHLRRRGQRGHRRAGRAVLGVLELLVRPPAARSRPARWPRGCSTSARAGPTALRPGRSPAPIPRRPRARRRGRPSIRPRAASASPTGSTTASRRRRSSCSPAARTPGATASGVTGARVASARGRGCSR